jgi:hypothetical protein
MRKSDDTQDQLAGGRLPGTGGDFLDETEVEGHRAMRGGEEARSRADEPDGASRRSIPDLEGDDVEGHHARSRDGDPDGLYRGGPTTQGEVIMRGPGDNPHGDR